MLASLFSTPFLNHEPLIDKKKKKMEANHRGSSKLAKWLFVGGRNPGFFLPRDAVSCLGSCYTREKGLYSLVGVPVGKMAVHFLSFLTSVIKKCCWSNQQQQNRIGHGIGRCLLAKSYGDWTVSPDRAPGTGTRNDWFSCVSSQKLGAANELSQLRLNHDD